MLVVCIIVVLHDSHDIAIHILHIDTVKYVLRLEEILIYSSVYVFFFSYTWFTLVSKLIVYKWVSTNWEITSTSIPVLGVCITSMNRYAFSRNSPLLCRGIEHNS